MVEVDRGDLTGLHFKSMGCLIEVLVGPAGESSRQKLGPEVVLSDKDGVQAGEHDMLVGPGVATQKQRGRVQSKRVVYRQTRRIEGRKIPGASGQHPAAESSEGGGPGIVRTVDAGTVDESCDVVEMLSDRCHSGARSYLRARKGEHFVPGAERVERGVSRGDRYVEGLRPYVGDGDIVV